MLKRVLIVLLLMLCSCGREEETKAVKEYIEPVNDISIFSLLDPAVQYRLRNANNGKDLSNSQFLMLGKEAYAGGLKDIEGNSVDLTKLDRFYLEVVSVDCSHCHKQLHDMASVMVMDEDIAFVQYFNVGDADQIHDVYAQEGLDMPEGAIIIPRDEDMKDYIVDTLGLEMYPSIVCFDKGKAVFSTGGETSVLTMEKIHDVAFSDPLTAEDLQDRDGNDAIASLRTIEDVKNDLSETNRKKIESIDNDGYSSDLTYRLMGKKADFQAFGGNAGGTYFNEVSDFSVYQDRKLIVFYTFLKDAGDIDKVRFINELMADDDADHLVVLIEGNQSSSAVLRSMDERFDCPVVSDHGRLPDDLFNFGIVAYPTAVFIDEGVLTGAYSNITEKETFATVVEMFLSDACIAYKANN